MITLQPSAALLVLCRRLPLFAPLFARPPLTLPSRLL